MALVDLINSWFGSFAGVLIGRLLPTRQAYRLADALTASIGKDDDSDIIQTLRRNQALVRDCDPADPAMLDAARMVLHNVGRGYADWFKTIYAPRREVIARCEIDDNVFETIEQCLQEERGLIFVGPHMSSFNMFLMSLGAQDVDGQVLTYPQPRAGYRIDNAIRRRFGFEITPISFESLRHAMNRLRGGGFVLTAVDRPDVGGEPLTFFGRKVRLPVGHARLALKTGSRMLVGTCQLVRTGHYHVKAEPVDTSGMSETSDPVQHIAQRALDVIQRYIEQRPEEWMMFLPIKALRSRDHVGSTQGERP